MGYVPYVGFATHRRATVRTRLYLYIKKKGPSHIRKLKNGLLFKVSKFLYC